ncbi:Hypothetical protein CFV354_1739 [Campylobacter fetus subsp. venerealis NCTC 10354]|nr:Hypothetical protein CFV354_1739 [Campylobacter fetus subsp. venerealis NCTC 10354]
MIGVALSTSPKLTTRELSSINVSEYPSFMIRIFISLLYVLIFFPYISIL